MIYGITGNTDKANLWGPVIELMNWLQEEEIPFVLDESVASGLLERSRVSADFAQRYSRTNLPHESEVILSFGGDGTLLSTVHQVGAHQTPILGVNIGRLGFLADTEVGQLQDTIRRLERGEYRIESRMVLEVRYEGLGGPAIQWALNDFVIQRSVAPQLVSIDVQIDGAPLTTFWADGLILATPTGSTAYSLSAGGPILTPNSGVIVLTPLAPHTLTVRPIVVSDQSVITVSAPETPFVSSVDGRSTQFEAGGATFSIRRAGHSVKLIKLPEQDFFQTLRTKLRWSGK